MDGHLLAQEIGQITLDQPLPVDVQALASSLGAQYLKCGRGWEYILEAGRTILLFREPSDEGFGNVYSPLTAEKLLQRIGDTELPVELSKALQSRIPEPKTESNLPVEDDTLEHQCLPPSNRLFENNQDLSPEEMLQEIHNAIQQLGSRFAVVPSLLEDYLNAVIRKCNEPIEQNIEDARSALSTLDRFSRDDQVADVIAAIGFYEIVRSEGITTASTGTRNR